MRLAVGIVVAGALAVLFGCCASLEGEYEARIGLMNPDYPLIPPTPTDETYAQGSVGQQYLEQYDKKFHEKDVLSTPESDIVESQEAP
jgi:hypothetical protein